MKSCLLCKAPMADEDDFGGDCIYCMARCDDPYALRELLRRAADELQDYCANKNGGMNDPLAMRIREILK